MYDKDNVFAKIIRGEIPCKKVAESEHALAFWDLQPRTRVHVLVIPKGGYENIVDFTARAPMAEQADFWNLLRRAASDLGVVKDFGLRVNTGPKAGQTVPHFHMHILSD